MPTPRRKRFKKRLQVRFWREGDDHPHPGYTTNVSMEGMFVATNAPVSPNERVKVEILDEERGFVVHGNVVHAARVSPLLAKLRQAGMGIRLLGVDEMIGELVGSTGEEMQDDDPLRPAAPVRTGFNQPAGIQTPARSESGSEGVLSSEEQPPHPEPAAAPDETSPEAAADGPAFHESMSEADPTLFSIRFETGGEFMAAFRRELQHGGMFITTEHPPEVNQEVTVEIGPDGDEPVSLEARVVSRRDVEGAHGTGQPPGINVDFKDLKSALQRLNRLREWAAKG